MILLAVTALSPVPLISMICCSSWIMAGLRLAQATCGESNHVPDQLRRSAAPIAVYIEAHLAELAKVLTPLPLQVESHVDAVAHRTIRSIKTRAREDAQLGDPYGRFQMAAGTHSPARYFKPRLLYGQPWLGYWATSGGTRRGCACPYLSMRSCT